MGDIWGSVALLCLPFLGNALFGLGGQLWSLVGHLWGTCLGEWGGRLMREDAITEWCQGGGGGGEGSGRGNGWKGGEYEED